MVIPQPDDAPPPTQPLGSSTSSIPIIFDSALKQYAAKTGADLTTHALTGKLGRCNTIDGVIDVFTDQLYLLKLYRNRRGRRAKVLEAVKPVVDAVLSLYASGAIFGSIGILLQTTRKVGEDFDTLIGLFDSIKIFLDRLKVYDQAPLPSTISEVITKVFAEMISIFALATKEMEQGTLKKFGKALLGHKGIRDAPERMNKLTQEESRAVAAETYGNTVAIKDSVHRALSIGVMINRDQLQSRYREWLSPPDPSTNHNFVSKGHHAGTSTWFIEGRVFEEWRKAGSLMWIYGKPGSGKSVLCSTIIEELQRLHTRGSSLTVVYFYFDFRDSKKQDFRGMLTSLIIQLSTASDTLCKLVSRSYSAHGNGLRQPKEEALVQCLLNMLSAPGQGVRCIILDAVDECPNNRLSPPRREILDFLNSIVSLRSSDLRVCITSRPEDDISTRVRPLAPHRICLENEVGHALDMERYIRYTVETDEKMRRWKEKTRNHVVETLSKNADGMFRYVACQLNILCNCPPATVDVTLQTLPRTLYETYESTLRRIKDDSEDNWRHAHRIFQCLSFSARPLRVDELSEVLAVDFDQTIPTLKLDWRSESAEDAILSTCPGSFIAIVDGYGGRIVQFAHFSVKEFLTSDRLANSSDRDVSRFHILSGVAHTVLAQACLATLLHLDISSIKESIRSYPLSFYAAEHWDNHARVDNVVDHINDAMDLLFDPQRPHFAAWIWAYDKDSFYYPKGRPAKPSATPFYHAALCGLTDLVHRLLIPQPESVNTRTGQQGTVLHAAAYGGHLSTVQALLDYGADANAECGKYCTALQAASCEGHLEVVRLLLERGADVGATGGNYGTALQAASTGGHLEIVQLFIERGADVNAMGGYDATALQIASAEGHLETVQLLLERGADINATGEWDGTALQAASASGHLEIVELLLGRGADVNTQVAGSRFVTCLTAASSTRHPDIVSLLLKHGADPHTVHGGRFASALVAASLEGDMEIVQILLDWGANVNPQVKTDLVPSLSMPSQSPKNASTGDAEYATPLAAASACYKPQLGLDIAQLLLARGANVNARGSKRGTALVIASYEGKQEMVQLLLNHGADVNDEGGGMYGNALQAASRSGSISSIRLLLKHGADVNARGTSVAKSALKVASARGYEDIVDLLSSAVQPNSVQLTR